MIPCRGRRQTVAKIKIEAILDAAFSLLSAADKRISAETFLQMLDGVTADSLFEAATSEHPHGHETAWRVLEPLLDKILAELSSNPHDPLGTARVENYLGYIRPALGNISGARILEIGSGVDAPLTLSALLYLNGAAECWAIDYAPISSPAAASKSLRRLLIDALTKPGKWNFTKTPRSLFVERVFEFDFDALAVGDLLKATRNVPITYRVATVEQLVDERFDFMFSVSVLEHLGFPDAAHQLARLIRVGGVMCHTVDFSDHAFHGGFAPNRWAYLTGQGDGYGINRIRLSRMLDEICAGGFRTVNVRRITERPPSEVVERIIPEYRHLSPDDIETVQATIEWQRVSN
jgi:hypothetical protein